MVLENCDASGTPSGGQVWDTIHEGWSWVLGVEDSFENSLNSVDPTITVPITTSSTFKLYCSGMGQSPDDTRLFCIDTASLPGP